MKLSIRRFSEIRRRMSPLHSDRWQPLVYQFDLMRHLVWRDFSLRYKQSALGILWSLVLPLAQLLVMVFVFQSVVPLNIEAYPAFVFCALLPWTWFSSCLGSAGALFVSNRDLVRHPNFTPQQLTSINTLSNLIMYLMALPILLAVLVIYNRPITPALLLLPVVMLLQGILIMGCSQIIATLNVFYRDVQHLVSILLTLLFYLTPVFYRPQAAVSHFQLLYEVSPMAVFITAYRDILFYGRSPAWGSLSVAGVVGLVAFGIGTLVYNYQKTNIIDTI